MGRASWRPRATMRLCEHPFISIVSLTRYRRRRRLPSRLKRWRSYAPLNDGNLLNAMLWMTWTHHCATNQSFCMTHTEVPSHSGGNAAQRSQSIKVRPLSAMASGENMRVGNSIICFETEKAGRMVDGCVCFNPKQECVNIGLTGREPDPVDADDRAAPSPDVASFTDKAKAKFKKLNPFDRTPMQPEVAFL
eukprot:GEMP01084652.1.p1 GENE.GEMP01084652.1~~GEMP01084652.1.p1  ORF type:complete len:192 (+),score=30.39 GEMP01084652.1:106-681(+)